MHKMEDRVDLLCLVRLNLFIISLDGMMEEDEQTIKFILVSRCAM